MDYEVRRNWVVWDNWFSSKEEALKQLAIREEEDPIGNFSVHKSDDENIDLDEETITIAESRYEELLEIEYKYNSLN